MGTGGKETKEAKEAKEAAEKARMLESFANAPDSQRVDDYLFTVVDGWSASCEYYVNSHELMHATVEPWPGRLEEAQAHVTLVGPTHTHWASAWHRLRWNIPSTALDRLSCIAGRPRSWHHPQSGHSLATAHSPSPLAALLAA